LENGFSKRNNDEKKGLNQMKKLSYDIEYQNGHAMFLESLNKMLR
jgi:hypothetical protein